MTAQQQQQLKLFTYSVIERKDEIEEVREAPVVDDQPLCRAVPRSHSCTKRYYNNAVPCVCARPARRRRRIILYVVCVSFVR